MTASASAPGKVVLSGEYAVLDGAPAICMAVDRRANVTIENEPTEAIEPSSLVLTIMRAAGVSVVPHCDTSAFSTPAGEKLGLGSSAALTVAMLAAFDGKQPELGRAIAAHREWQGGSGSGADIACSLHGGLIEYAMEDAEVSPIAWPEGLEFRLLWSGAPSSTGEKLSRLAGIARRPSADHLVTQADSVAAAWRSGDAYKVLSAYGEYTETLRAFSVDHKLGIFDAGHDEIVDAATAANIVYKPCGAGGGDIGIALSTNAAAGLVNNICRGRSIDDL
ncbi:MAG: hypothetical protein AAFN50_06160, partial [Pseudomonadota bacterium]